MCVCVCVCALCVHVSLCACVFGVYVHACVCVCGVCVCVHARVCACMCACLALRLRTHGPSGGRLPAEPSPRGLTWDGELVQRHVPEPRVQRRHPVRVRLGGVGQAAEGAGRAHLPAHRRPSREILGRKRGSAGVKTGRAEGTVLAARRPGSEKREPAGFSPRERMGCCRGQMSSRDRMRQREMDRDVKRDTGGEVRV